MMSTTQPRGSMKTNVLVLGQYEDTVPSDKYFNNSVDDTGK